MKEGNLGNILIKYLCKCSPNEVNILSKRFLRIDAIERFNYKNRTHKWQRATMAVALQYLKCGKQRKDYNVSKKLLFL